MALSLREALPAWLALGGLAALAWSQTLADARAMGNAPGTMGMPIGGFLAMWLAMMIAMMLPSAAPVAILWSRAIARDSSRPRRAWRLALFVSGYLAAWGALGLLAYALLRGTESLLARVPGAAPGLAAAIFAVAGLYQFTPQKQLCLRHCRSPLAALAHYTSLRGPLRDGEVGVRHGLFCAGCCAGLMALLACVGLMNVPAMVALTATVFLEKVWRHGELLGRAVGFSLLALAALAPFTPALWAGLAQPG